MLKGIVCTVLAILYPIFCKTVVQDHFVHLMGNSQVAKFVMVYVIFLLPEAVLACVAAKAFESRKNAGRSIDQLDRRNEIERLLAGEKSLNISFWSYYILSAAFTVLFTQYLGSPVFKFALGRRWLDIAVASSALFAFQLISIIGTWRSSKRYEGSARWATLVRVMMVLSMTVIWLYFIWTVFRK
jgi:hypothetical protein